MNGDSGNPIPDAWHVKHRQQLFYQKTSFLLDQTVLARTSATLHLGFFECFGSQIRCMQHTAQNARCFQREVEGAKAPAS